MGINLLSKKINIFGVDYEITKIQEKHPNAFALQCEATLVNDKGENIGSIQAEIPYILKDGYVCPKNM